MQGFRILIVDDESEFRDFYELILGDKGYEVYTAFSGEDCLQMVEKNPVDLVITDLKMTGIDGIQLLEKLKDTVPECAVIIITGYGTVETAVEAIRKGAFGYFIKGHNPEELIIEIEKLVKMRSLEASNKRMSEKLTKEQWHLDTKSDKFRNVLTLAEKASESMANVLIYGESGTGKEVLANYIHQLSEEKNNPFIDVNCQVYSKNTIESELFGHEKGAFTGAIERRIGRFEEAAGGTLFLDEIGELTPYVQTKLLRVLDTKSFERMGSNRKISVDFRLICATHRNLEEEVINNNFREDLLYRINTLVIEITPLRERKEDLPDLIRYFFIKYQNEMKKKEIEVSNKTMDFLLNYDYPGNIRELKNIIERIVVLNDEDLIHRHILSCMGQGVGKQDKLSESSCRSYTPMSLRDFRKEKEREHIISTIHYCNEDLDQVAEILQITRRQLYNLLKEIER
ncbi:sigma-54-dependent transcriptional regulator [Alkaliphilus oremlandii]|uniref:Stage 0 sporulation protein A homolog n=1 Tax=Alkaliphilus oremlandii (strain OhILAs) TaxID=350688 RepID=A8MMD4_ALKOO|nr:sigma-54 dependent transcriptional regulator [Alkaliphilus oremlandii]ABW18301.1 two component, sigma54 specific, transcriptional regulator, Fis family [Alkaliphilus oremlandii OhILAs]